MIGVFGWLGRVADPAQTLRDMAPEFQAQQARASGEAALGGATFSSESGIDAAVDGRVRWKDATLADIAQARGPAAALIAAYLKYGDQFIHHVFGHFALALAQPEKKLVILATDRIGARPLCYAHTRNGGFVFAPTTDLLRAHPELRATLAPQALFDFMYFHMIPSPYTAYHEIKKLEPAQMLRYEAGKTQLRYYWQPAFTENERDFGALGDEFLKLLRASVQHCDPSDDTGAFLSGGTDSSTVSGMLSGLRRPNKARTYSIGFSQQGYDEISYARIAAKHFDTDQHEYYVTPEDVADAFPRVARAYDEPFGNSSAIPTLFCARMAKKDGINVMLAGDGGDELFGGNARYAKQKIFNLYHAIPAPLRGAVLEPMFVSLPFAKWLPPTRKIRSYIEQARMPMPDRMESYNFLHRTGLTTFFTAEFLRQVNSNHPIEALRETYNRTSDASLLNRMLFLDWKITLADNDLRKVNRMCAAEGIEVRYPMLDDDLVEFSARVPSDFKLKGLKLRYFFKKSLENFLPHEIIHKTKHGFGLPFGEWLKTTPALQDVIYSSLKSFKQRGIVRPEYIDELIATHRAGHAAYYGTMIWVLAMLEQWFQQHRVNP